MLKSSFQTMGRCAGLVLLLGLSSVVSAQVSAQVSPTPKVLSSLPGEEGGMALAINNKGVAAGVSGGWVEMTAVRWDRKGRVTELPPLPGHPYSMAIAINLRGEVAGISGDDLGWFYHESNDSLAVLWDLAGEPHVLPPLAGDTRSYAADINNAGEVVGTSFGAGHSTAVIWNREGTPRVLLGGTQGSAINNRGMAAGVGVDGVTLWGRKGTPRNLMSPGRECDYDLAPSITGITWRGEVLGHAKYEEEYCAPVIWNRAGDPEFLELLVPEDTSIFDPYWESYGLGIEATGEVAGKTIVGHAVLWDRSGTMILLPFPEGYGYGEALAINNRGAIVGFSSGPGAISGEFIEQPVVWR